jgi:predicted nucleic acid-binding protein
MKRSGRAAVSAFWDSSAIVSLLCHQRGHERLRKVYPALARIVIWWGSWTECSTAFESLERRGILSARDRAAVFARFSHLASTWDEIIDLDEVREEADALIGRHDLRSGDSLQLAAARVWSAGARDRPFVCTDGALRVAAAREGFDVRPTAVE